MKIGIPRGLLYCKYHPFFNEFFYELGGEIITSEETNKNILDEGVKYSVDEACLPIKIFHGHVASIKDRCDIVIIPRIMRIRKDEYICPKFCGLPEMIKYNVKSMPRIIGEPIYAQSQKSLYNFAKVAGEYVTKDVGKISKAFLSAVKKQQEYNTGINDVGYNKSVVLLGHPYNIYDSFINMNLKKKLNKLGIGIITEELVSEKHIDQQIKELSKKPFWSFASNSFGAATYLYKNKKIDGVVYISSFSCGIDSIVIELIKDRIDNFPILVLKIDEHTGEAGLDTRIEAFADMFERW